MDSRKSRMKFLFYIFFPILKLFIDDISLENIDL